MFSLSLVTTVVPEKGHVFILEMEANEQKSGFLFHTPE